MHAIDAQNYLQHVNVLHYIHDVCIIDYVHMNVMFVTNDGQQVLIDIVIQWYIIVNKQMMVVQIVSLFVLHAMVLIEYLLIETRLENINDWNILILIDSSIMLQFMWLINIVPIIPVFQNFDYWKYRNQICIIWIESVVFCNDHQFQYQANTFLSLCSFRVAIIYISQLGNNII
jgi:riboflavin transporter FmnP